MEIVGRIKLIGEVQDVSATFRKRELVITTEEQYPQHLLIEFVQDKCQLLDGFQLGEMVKVGINLRGREWVSPQGETKYFNSIQGWRIERPMMQQPVQPAQGYMPQGQMPQAPAQPTQAPQNTQPFPPAPNVAADEEDDLPF